jgi:hypothetical protein
MKGIISHKCHTLVLRELKILVCWFDPAVVSSITALEPKLTEPGFYTISKAGHFVSIVSKETGSTIGIDSI